jgi:hypothetical protein
LHKYLRAIGFSSIRNRIEYENLIRLCVQDATKREYTTKDISSEEAGTLNADENMTALFYRDFADGLGLAVCGEYDENNHFSYDYCFPYLRGEEISSYEDITVERHMEKESYAGICDEIKVGVTLIFYLQNMIPYIKAKNTGTLPMKGTSLVLSGLSCQGSIMMPLKKDKKDILKTQKATVSRNDRIRAARRGDEEAIESLTLEDIDTYAEITRRLKQEDILTIVESYFMPFGIARDEYSVLGDILSVEKVENSLTHEQVI